MVMRGQGQTPKRKDLRRKAKALQRSAWRDKAQQGHSMAVFGKEVQRHSSVKQSEKWQGHSKECIAKSGKGIA